MKEDDTHNDDLNEPIHHKIEEFNKLYDQYSGLVLGYICSIISEKEVAEEILRRVFVMMLNDFENAPDFAERWFPRLMAIANKEIPGEADFKLAWVEHWKSFRIYYAAAIISRQVTRQTKANTLCSLCLRGTLKIYA